MSLAVTHPIRVRSGVIAVPGQMDTDGHKTLPTHTGCLRFTGSTENPPEGGKILRIRASKLYATKERVADEFEAVPR